MLTCMFRCSYKCSYDTLRNGMLKIQHLVLRRDSPGYTRTFTFKDQTAFNWTAAPRFLAQASSWQLPNIPSFAHTFRSPLHTHAVRHSSLNLCRQSICSAFGRST